MIRKLVIAAVAVGAGLFILNSTHLGSYARTAWSKVRATAKRQVPLEFQLETIRNEVAQLGPDMRRNISLIAGETVAVENLKEEIAMVQSKLDQETVAIRDMNHTMQAGDAKVVFNDETYSKTRFATILQKKLTAAKQCRENLEAKKGLLEAKEKALDAAKEQLSNVRTQKESMELEIARIEAELKTMRAEQAKSSCVLTLDDSRVNHIRESLSEIRNQIKVMETEKNLLGQFGDEGTLRNNKTKSATQLSKEVDEFLGDTKADEGTIAKKQ